MLGLFKKSNVKRKEKRETLNVKMRAGEVRARRVRTLGTLFGFSFTLFLLVMLGWKGIEYVLREAVYKNPQLAIDRIEIETDGVLSHEKIREWARVKNGDNLLALDLTRLKRDLELRPIVESASAEKTLPRHLKISVTERKPLATVYLYKPGGGFERLFVDAAGMVIPPLLRDERNPAADPNPSKLPVLTGFNARELRPGMFIDSPQLRAALNLLIELERSHAATVAEFRTIDLSHPPTLLAITDQNVEVTFSPDNFPRQLARLQTTLQFARTQHKQLAALDLAVGNYVPARWHEPSTNAPAATPLLPQNPKPKKKHV